MTPVVLDLDEDDYEALLGPSRSVTWRIAFQFRMAIRGESPVAFRRLQARIPTVPRTVSNPQLQKRFGGTVVPHVREPSPPGRPHTTSRPTVAFVGTPRRHKGVDLLRTAVAQLAEEGFRLVVTGAQPRDARPWERWVGTTSLTEGQQLLASADIVAIPSLATDYSPTQLPAKLVDAMLTGRAVVASDTPPIRWALRETGALVPPGDLETLTEALRRLRRPRTRDSLGAAARARALNMFTPAAVASRFAKALET